MNPVLKGYLRLCRPPNLPTAAADILAGLAIAGFIADSNWSTSALFLVFSSIFLYAGGVVFNDYFDFELDKIERPERALPSGLIKRKNAVIFGAVLFMIGLTFAFANSKISGLIAIALITAILIYDAQAKHHSFFGPLTMGICRGLNLLLGMSIILPLFHWHYIGIPVLFIFSVTLVSRGEVHGNNKRNLILSGVLYASVILCVILLHQYFGSEQNWYLLFLAIFGLMVLLPLIKAYRENIPKNIMKAVKAGVLSIILLDASLATAFAGILYGLIILLLLPISIGLAKAFAVT